MPKTHSEEEKEQARLRKIEYQKEYEKKTKYASKIKYQNKNIVKITLKFVKTTESDLIERIESQENKAGYIKRLVREDMNKSRQQNIE